MSLLLKRSFGICHHIWPQVNGLGSRDQRCAKGKKYTIIFRNLAGPVAQSVERWTPYGGSVRPGFKSPGFEARRAPDVYRASWLVWLRLVAGRNQSKSAIGTGRARICAYVKLSTLNSAIGRSGIARSEGRGQGQRNKLCLAAALSLPILPIKGFGLNLKKIFFCE